ncbi:hypothetical protein V5O48_000831 [Marasmius crinis-equi]|uniref:Uncharacterized protein n=1 Tax=Marasmius crinis-equi TaxID=585013 RepID=A0ABR3G0R5_9AGAR
MARRNPPRLHRLPQRLDYTLIPAPLDLSLNNLTEKTEKSPLPAIIVTPSSPSEDHRFSIAFIAPPSNKWTLRQRLSSNFFSFRVQSVLLLFLVAVVMVCHLLTHEMATLGRLPDSHSEFTLQDGRSIEDWFASQQFLGHLSPGDNEREYIVMEAL